MLVGRSMGSAVFDMRIITLPQSPSLCHFVWRQHVTHRMMAGSKGSASREPLDGSTHVDDFMTFLSVANVTAGTIRQYDQVLRDFFAALAGEVPSCFEVTTAQLRQYVIGLQQRGLAAKTVCDRVLTLKRYFAFLTAEGYITTDPAVRLAVPRTGKHLPRALTLAETQVLFAAMAEERAPIGQRDQVLFSLLYGVGLRVGEAVRLRLCDLDFEQKMLRVTGKGDRERCVYLKPALMDGVRLYIDEQSISGYLFPGRDEGHLSTRNVSYRLVHYTRRAGLHRHVSPHTLRHSIAVHYLQGGAPVSFVQALLGHTNLATTGVYLQLTDAMAREITLRTPTALDLAPAAFPPLANAAGDGGGRDRAPLDEVEAWLAWAGL